MKNLVLLAVYLALSASCGAEDLGKHVVAEMLDCTFHRKGSWVDPTLYPDGKVRFSYVIQRSTTSSPGRLYVAFWNLRKTEGKLVVFHISKTADKKDAFAIANEGWIWDNKGKLDVRDLQGGLYVYEEIKALLPKLKRRKTTVRAVDQLRATSAVCSSPLEPQAGR